MLSVDDFYRVVACIDRVFYDMDPILFERQSLVLSRTSKDFQVSSSVN
jgi:hypothetical protein